MEANQGNPEALVKFINQIVSSEGINVADCTLNEGRLNLILEGLDIPSQERTVKLISKALKNFKLPDRTTVYIEGRKVGHDSPYWNHKIELIHSGEKEPKTNQKRAKTNRNFFNTPTIIASVVILGAVTLWSFLKKHSSYDDNFPRNAEVEVVTINQSREGSVLKNETQWVTQIREEGETIKLTEKDFIHCFPKKNWHINIEGGQRPPKPTLPLQEAVKRYGLTQEDLDKVSCREHLILEWDNNRFFAQYTGDSDDSLELKLETIGINGTGWRDVCEIRDKEIRCVGIARDDFAEVAANPWSYPDHHTFRNTFKLKD